jgi:hypothetical protein
MTIYPYLLNTTWVFDDERTGLKEEAFVCGMTEMISRLVEAKAIPNATSGFSLTFGDEPFDGADAELVWLRSEGEARNATAGNWYGGTVAGEYMQGWLCPALGLYFTAAPARLFVRADPLPAGIDPIWHVAPDDPRQRRFMSAEGE